MLIVVLLAGLLVIGPQRPSEPVLEGRRLSEWTEVLAGPWSLSRTQATRVLIKAGPALVPALVHQLETSDSLPLRLLTKSGSAVPAQIRARLGIWWGKGRSTDRRHDAALALTLLGPVAEPALPALSNRLRAPVLDPRDWLVLHACARAMAVIGDRGIQVLADVLRGGRPEGRLAALQALAQCGPAGVPAAPAVVALWTEPAAPSWTRMIDGFMAQCGSGVVPPALAVFGVENPEAHRLFWDALQPMMVAHREYRTSLWERAIALDVASRRRLAVSLNDLAPGQNWAAVLGLRLLGDPDPVVCQAAGAWLRQGWDRVRLEALMDRQPREVQERGRPVLATLER